MGQKRSRLQELAKQLKGAKKLLQAVVENPELRSGLIDQALRRNPPQPQSSAQPRSALQAPAGLSEFSRTASASAVLEFPPEQILTFLTDFSQFPQWLVMHSRWRGEAPAEAYVGQQFTQQVMLIGIPADVQWTVAQAKFPIVELQGRGPMGLTLGLWLQVQLAQDGVGAAIRFDAGLDGQPIQGPMGASLLRSIEEALRESLAKLPAAMNSAGTGVLLPRREQRDPVTHLATGQLLDPATPIIVGVGQVVLRDSDNTTLPDPVTHSIKALQKAAQDTGVGTGFLQKADSVYAVPSASWTYRDQARLVAEGLGLGTIPTVQSSTFGGDGGQLLINTAAQSISDGQAEIILVTGAESGATLANAQRRGVTPDWPLQSSDVAPGLVVGVDRTANNDAETAVGLGAPIYMYALLESAVQAKLGVAKAQHEKDISALWSNFSAVAAKNPYAWLPKEFSAEEIRNTSADNRKVSEPYTKLECANLQVDLATGLIVCSVAAAEAAGISQDKWVFLHAGASAHDEWFVSERADLAASPAIRSIGAAVLDHVGLAISDIEYVDLYSCFPAAVQISAQELGLPINDPQRPLTVTGGLTFAGGPGNNYGAHAVATLVGILRNNPESFGLSTSLGWYSTKHSTGIYSVTPPTSPYQHLRPVVDNPPSRPVLADYAGPAVIEAYTVPYDRQGNPEAAIFSLLVPTGERYLLRDKHSKAIALLLDKDPLGWPVTVHSGSVEVVSTERSELPAPPPPPVLVERRGPITIITLNRPEVRNAINLATALALERIIDEFEADSTARVAILTGAGSSFCAGMDLKAAARGEFPLTENRGMLGLTAKPPVKPLIAAVEGPALAGGCELALAADLIVATKDSIFGIPEAKRGLVAAAGGVMRLTERLPRNLAMELALTAEPMSAERLAELGLVNRLTGPGKALEVALELAAKIAANAPLSIKVSKQIVTESSQWAADDAATRQLALAAPIMASQDAAEGVLSFAQGREPQWKGR
ncbi:MAG: type II toxin-antitoxin system Rv0910 family toxin [Mycobacteriaceae bacterium]